MNDKFGRKINYARISLTDRCNLSCVYCEESSLQHDKIYINDDLTFENYKFIIKGLSDIGITKIEFLGGEPLLYPNLKELINFTYEECNIDNISINTNGIGLATIARELRGYGLNEVNIRLDSLKEYKYKTISGNGELKYVLDSIMTCVKLGIKVKVDCIPINRFNDDELLDFIALITNYPIEVRFIELIPINRLKDLYESGYFNLKEFIEEIEEIYRINNPQDSIGEYYTFNGARGKISIINPLRDYSCSRCNIVEITSSGTVKLCSLSEEEKDIRFYLDKPMIFREILKEIIMEKPERFYLNY